MIPRIITAVFCVLVCVAVAFILYDDSHHHPLI